MSRRPRRLYGNNTATVVGIRWSSTTRILLHKFDLTSDCALGSVLLVGIYSSVTFWSNTEWHFFMSGDLGAKLSKFCELLRRFRPAVG